MHQIEVINEHGKIERYIEIDTSMIQALFVIGDMLRLKCGVYKVVEVVPGLFEGFLKTWGWLHFAKAIEDTCRQKNAGIVK